MSQQLLEGRVELTEAQRIQELKHENVELRHRIERLELELRQAKLTNATAASNLRQLLEPLYHALQMVFGEIDVIIPEGSAKTAAAPSERSTAVWEAWKSRLGTTPAKIIDALLTHRDLNTQQLAIATGLHRSTIPTAIYKLNKAGLINKNGGRFSLKEI